MMELVLVLYKLPAVAEELHKQVEVLHKPVAVEVLHKPVAAEVLHKLIDVVARRKQVFVEVVEYNWAEFAEVAAVVMVAVQYMLY